MNTVNLRHTHPNLYRLAMVLALTHAALGLNFFFTSPTFNPLGIPYPVVGAVFLVLGVSKIIFLNFVLDLAWVRRVMAAQVFLAAFWGIGAGITYIQGLTSLQLTILYGGFAFIEVFLLIEPPVNPLTKQRGL